MIRLKEKEFEDIVQYMRTIYGINLEKKKVLIECRLSKELERYGLSSYTRYMDMVRRDTTGELAGELINRLTTNYTYFMREPAHYEIFKKTVLPEVIQKKHYGTFNIWCAGCSTGEECYTLAMTLADFIEHTQHMSAVRITASDISGEVLERAKKGIYPMREWDSIPANWQKKYCRVIDEKWFAVKDKLKDNIRFLRHNLMDGMVENKTYDLILCRNVMIYFDYASREKLIMSMEKSLNPGGYLFIGHAELLSVKETKLLSVYPAVYKKMSS